jgi:hypothetical protein
MAKEIAPLTERQKTLVVNNIVRACADITKLNRTGYNFLYLAQGFIAHYNVYGFIDYYSRNDLRTDILRNTKWNMWDNFRPGDRDYDYYMTKAEIYRRVVTAIS